MKLPHPVSLILLGLAVILAASSHDGVVLFLGGLSLVLGARYVAKTHLQLLLKRSRWLLLTMLAMFGWLTPGTPVLFVPGATEEGLLLAGENLARLGIAIATVALILKALPAAELVGGIRSLLGPLTLLKISRDRIAVRLALTLSEVEVSLNSGSEEPARTARTLVLPTSGFGVLDLLLGVLASALLLWALLT